MEIKVNYGQLYECGNDITENTENLLVEFNKLLEIIDNMKANWDGTDYNNFRTTAVTYIENQQEMIDKMDFMGRFMIYSSNSYEKMNNEWGETMKRIGEDKDEKKYFN